MNEQIAKENKPKLEAELQRLKTILENRADKDGAGEFPGDYKPRFTEAGRDNEENASEVEQFANDLGVTMDLEARMKQIENALKRIEDGTYGKCIQGDDIEEERLRAVPESETCMKHAA